MGDSYKNIKAIIFHLDWNLSHFRWTCFLLESYTARLFVLEIGHRFKDGRGFGGAWDGLS